MPSPPLPPRIELTGDLSTVHSTLSKGRNRSITTALQSPGNSQGKASAAFANALAVFCTLLMVGLLFTLWKWQRAEKSEAAAKRQTEISSKLSDGFLQELVKAREQSAKLDRERSNLVKLLGDAERLHANLRSEVGAWQQRHEAAVEVSQQAMAESSMTHQALNSTRSLLAQTNNALSDERSAAEEDLAQAEDARQKLEAQAGQLANQVNVAEAQKRAADRVNADLGMKTQALTNENARLDGDVNRLRGVINNLEFLKNELNNRNQALAIEVNQLRLTVGGLEAKIRSMEQEKEKDNKQKRNN